LSIIMAHYSLDWGVVGHSWAVEHLAKSLMYGRLRHAYLIAGVSGVGKTTLARGFARALECTSDTLRPCGECRACRLIETNGYADVNIIQAQDKTLKIEQIRELQHTLALRPVEGRYRVVILENFHEASGQAQDALLKTLEEPPPFVVLLLTVDYIGNVLATIRSRCQPINLRPLAAAQVRDALVNQGVDSEKAVLLAQLSGGRLGWALQAAKDDSALETRNAALRALETLISADRVARFRFAEQAAQNKDGLPEMLAYWQNYWRDVLLSLEAARVGLTNRDHRHAIEQLTAALHVEDAQRALDAIGRTLKYIDQYVNPRLALEVLMLDLPRHKLLIAPPKN
jgi:DNA polymerase-3 subunit delta'